MTAAIEALRAVFAVHDTPKTIRPVDEDGLWSLFYTGDGKTAPIYGFAATFPLEEDARFILARLQSTGGGTDG